MGLNLSPTIRNRAKRAYRYAHLVNHRQGAHAKAPIDVDKQKTQLSSNERHYLTVHNCLILDQHKRFLDEHSI